MKKNMYYRVVNPKENTGNVIDSRNFQQYPRKKRAVELFELYKWVYLLSEKTGIRLSSSINVAKHYGSIIELIQDKVRNNESSIQLETFLVYDDPIRTILMNDLVDFIINYNNVYEKTNCYIDYGDEPYVWEYIWEYVRNKVNSNLPSRLFSCFLFDNLKNAEKFKKEDFNAGNQIVSIKIEEKRNIDKFDMNWLTDVPVTATALEAYDYASNYWLKRETTKPIWEFLCDGTYVSRVY